MMGRIQWDERALTRVVSGSSMLKAQMDVIGGWQAVKCRNQVNAAMKSSGGRVAHSTMRTGFGFTVDNVQELNGWPVGIVHPTNRIMRDILRKHSGIIHW